MSIRDVKEHELKNLLKDFRYEKGVLFSDKDVSVLILVYSKEKREDEEIDYTDFSVVYP